MVKTMDQLKALWHSEVHDERKWAANMVSLLLYSLYVFVYNFVWFLIDWATESFLFYMLWIDYWVSLAVLILGITAIVISV